MSTLHRLERRMEEIRERLLAESQKEYSSKVTALSFQLDNLERQVYDQRVREARSAEMNRRAHVKFVRAQGRLAFE